MPHLVKELGSRFLHPIKELLPNSKSLEPMLGLHWGEEREEIKIENEVGILNQLK